MTEIDIPTKKELEDVIEIISDIYLVPYDRKPNIIENKFNESIMNAINYLVIAKVCLKEIKI